MQKHQFLEREPELDAAEAAAAVLESRSAPRVGTDFPIELNGAAFKSPLPARARDISTGGICFATASQVALESLRSVTLNLPDGRVRFKVEGKWQTNEGFDESVLTGAVFVGLGPSESQTLWDVVEKSGREIGSFLYESLREQGASLDDAMNIARTTRIRVVPRGRFIYQRHQAPVGCDDSIFIIRRGSAEMLVPTRRGREIRLGKLSPGAVLGGAGSVAGMLPLESVQTNEETSLLEISRSAFSYLRVAKPLLANWLGQVVMANHLRRLDEVITRLG
ncbi:MAG: cyclic nucleotide-binding domain-containing protein [Myxococcota bacterium]|jgi:CRP-like cAMP-binding protein|nr:cyclic nucleotide-binding domain-containing protein [Myxococcota bacterium]